MAEELWSQIKTRNWIMQLAENIATEILNRHSETVETPGRYVSVHDINYQAEHDKNVLELEVEIHYLSDIGDWMEKVIIRHFNSDIEFSQELDSYNKLSARTDPFEYINPIPRIYSDRNDLVHIYLAPKGMKFAELDIPDELMNFQLGNLLALLHTGDIKKLNLEQYRNMVTYLINQLQFDAVDKEIIVEGIENEFKILQSSYGAYEPVCQIDPRYITIIPSTNTYSKSAIIQGQVHGIEIKPSLLGENELDRMEDIANLFAEVGFMEYCKTGVVTGTQNKIFNLMEGYEIFFEQFTTSPIDKIYPNGLTLDLHMLIGAWLIALYAENSAENIDMNLVTQYSLFVLTYNPYQVYGQFKYHLEQSNFV